VAVLLRNSTDQKVRKQKVRKDGKNLIGLPQFYSSEPPMVALTSSWLLSLSRIASYFSSHSMSLFNERYGTSCGKLPPQSRVTVSSSSTPEQQIRQP
jgi:hypothetical protein